MTNFGWEEKAFEQDVFLINKDKKSLRYLIDADRSILLHEVT